MLRRSIRIGLAPFSLTGPLPRGRMLFLERIFRTKMVRVLRTLYRLTRPCFSGRQTGTGDCLHMVLPPHGLTGTPRFHQTITLNAT